MTPEPITLWDPSERSIGVELVGREPDGSLWLKRSDGMRLLVPVEAIRRRAGNDLHLGVPIDAIAIGATSRTEREVVPLAAERLVVEKRPRTRATVEVHTRTHVREEEIDEELTREVVDVVRVPIDRYVDTPAAIRVEGDTTIVPVHEEVLVVEKRLLLKEEVHMTKRLEERHERQRIGLRSQTADIERSEAEGG